MQRLLDIVLAGMALLVLAPLLIPLAVVLRLTGEGEIFFVQARVGKDRKPFGLLKFATMLKASPSMGTGTITLKNDPRILPVGGFLRRTKLNELPQLLNILKGDMSVIGPRPQDQRCFDAFPPELQAQIVKVRPGLSGIGSIIFHDEDEILHAVKEPIHFYDRVIAPYKGALEQWYIENQGLKTYLLLILLTLWVVFFRGDRIAWRLFDLPAPPGELHELILGARGGATDADRPTS